MAKSAPGTIHHSLALDSGGSVDRVSVLVRLVSNESNSPTAFNEGRVRLSESSWNLEGMEVDGWRESSASSVCIVVDVATEGPRMLRCLPIVWPELPPAVILF